MLKRLGDTCTFVGGGTPSKKNPDFYKGSIPWATVRDMNVRVIETTEHSITPEAVRQSATNIIPNGEIVISTHVGLGKVCFLGQDTAINQDLKAVIPNGELSRRYLYYWFISKTDELIANGKGATVKGVTLDFVKNLKIQVLTEREQEVVSDTLDKVYNVIELADAQVSRLNQLVKSRFVEMFGGEKTERAMPDICEIIDGDRGKNYPTQGDFTSNGFCLFLSAKNVTKDGFSFETQSYISKAKDDALRKGKLKRGDVVLTTRGTIGNIAFYDKNVPFDNIRINSGMVILRMRNGIDPVYFIHAFNAKMQVVARRLVSGTAQPQLPISVMNKIMLPLPPLALQREFAAFVEKVDKLAFAARRRRDVARQMYRAKIQEFFG